MSAPPLRDHILARATLAGVGLHPDELDKLAEYYSLLERWNQKINLTALPLAARENSTIDRLIVEPLIAASEFPGDPVTWVDFGSGGGSPAIPIKIVRPIAGLTMVESRERKSAFLREAVSTLALSNTRVHTGRIEEHGQSTAREHQTLRPDTADIVTVRAVRLDAEMLTAAREILKLHGRLLLFCTEKPASPFSGFRVAAERALFPSTGFLLALEKASE